MGVILIGVIVSVVATYGIGKEFWSEGLFDWIMAGFTGLCVGALVTLLSMLGVLVADVKPVNPTKVEIYAIKDNSEVNGHFSLGYGSVDEEQYYYYIVEDENEFKEVEKALVDKSKLKEEDLDKPYVTVYDEKFKSAFARFMYGTLSGDQQYEFHIPQDTITTEYKVDLE